MNHRCQHVTRQWSSHWKPISKSHYQLYQANCQKCLHLSLMRKQGEHILRMPGRVLLGLFQRKCAKVWPQPGREIIDVPRNLVEKKKGKWWKYHDIGSTNSGYSVLHVQSGRFSEVITTAPCNRGIATPVICFGISMNNTRMRRVGGEMWFRRPLGEMTSDGIWVHAPTTERSMSELLRTEKIFHRESSSRCLVFKRRY